MYGGYCSKALVEAQTPEQTESSTSVSVTHPSSVVINSFTTTG